MLQRVVRFVVFRLVRLFYSHIEVRGSERLQAERPVVFVLNHPNGVLDPVLLMTALGRPVTFLSKSTLFAYPVSRWAAQTFGALPVYRSRDIGRRGGARDSEDMAAQNGKIFAQCRALLLEGQAIALFPEGATHSEPRLLRLQTGAARIALSAAAESDWNTNLAVIPIGLWYANKTRFRTSVLLVIGEPLPMHTYAERYVSDAWSTTREFTDQLEKCLAAVVLQAENRMLLRSMPAIAAWTTPKGQDADLGDRHAWAAMLLAAYEKLQQSDPDCLRHIEQNVRRYASLLHALGIVDPWQLERMSTPSWRALKLALILVLLGLPALLGVLVSYIPHRLSGRLSRALNPRDRSQSSLLKILGGTVLEIIAWLAEAVLIGMWVGAMWGVLLFLVAPFCAYSAVRWRELWKAFRNVVSVLRVRGRTGGLAANLMARRQALARQVMAAVASVQGSTPGHANDRTPQDLAAP